MDVFKEIERSLITTYKKSIWCKFIEAVKEYRLIKDGDKIAVCISGGKDSFLMAKCFQELARHGRQNFEAVYLVMNPGYNAENLQKVKDNAARLNVPVEIFDTDIYDTAAKSGGSPCYLCARMRRGHLYSEAQKRGCNKIALAHHADDVAETLLMSIIYGAQIQGMPPALKSKNFENMELIRPMYRIEEQYIKNWRDRHNLDFIRCACRFTENCVITDDLDYETASVGKRAETKLLLSLIKKKNPKVVRNIVTAMSNVSLETLILDK